MTSSYDGEKIFCDRSIRNTNFFLKKHIPVDQTNKTIQMNEWIPSSTFYFDSSVWQYMVTDEQSSIDAVNMNTPNIISASFGEIDETISGMKLKFHVESGAVDVNVSIVLLSVETNDEITSVSRNLNNIGVGEYYTNVSLSQEVTIRENSFCRVKIEFQPITATDIKIFGVYVIKNKQM